MTNKIVAQKPFPIGFNEKKTRIETGESVKTKSKKTYSLIFNQTSTQELYQNFFNQIPPRPGILIIMGLRKDKSSFVLEILRSNDNLREVFNTPKINPDGTLKSRLNWLMETKANKNLRRIYLQLASAS